MQSMLFRSRSARALDAKGRLMLPPKFREILLARSEGGRLALVTYDNCIVGFPWPDWIDFEQKLTHMPIAPLIIRNFKRLVVGGMEDHCADNQGRILLSREQLAYAGIEKDVVLQGVGARFEIWAPERLAAILAQNVDDVAPSLADSGIDLVF